MKNMKDGKDNKSKVYIKKTSTSKPKYKWIITIFIWTFIISGCISFFTETVMNNVSLVVAFIVLIAIVCIGIIFDVIGVAVTAADEVPFHAMASRKVKGAKKAVMLIRNADKVSSFCNDVIGDICGVVSGGTGAVIVGTIITTTSIKNNILLSILVSAMIASFTVGGKAIGKNYALAESNNIVYVVAWIFDTIKKD